eukprot:9623281-Lingulodinium_polyedra.AAC.1
MTSMISVSTGLTPCTSPCRTRPGTRKRWLAPLARQNLPLPTLLPRLRETSIVEEATQPPVFWLWTVKQGGK